MQEVEAFLEVGDVIHKGGNRAAGVSLWPLDLDDISSQVCEQLRAVSTPAIGQV
jgi:hypothetical protein